MLIQTHRQISEAIINTLADNTAITINKIYFRGGCNLTDIFWANPGHTKEESFHYLSASISEIQQRQFSRNNPGGQRDFFVKSGIICHYICDYFCRAHNDPGYKNLLPHLIYENRLQTEFKTYNLVKIGKNAVNKKLNRFDVALPSLTDYIQNEYLTYISEKPNMKKDIYFAVETSTLVAAALMRYIHRDCRYQAA